MPSEAAPPTVTSNRRLIWRIALATIAWSPTPCWSFFSSCLSPDPSFPRQYELNVSSWLVLPFLDYNNMMLTKSKECEKQLCSTKSMSKNARIDSYVCYGTYCMCDSCTVPIPQSILPFHFFWEDLDWKIFATEQLQYVLVDLIFGRIAGRGSPALGRFFLSENSGDGMVREGRSAVGSCFCCNAFWCARQQCPCKMHIFWSSLPFYIYCVLLELNLWKRKPSSYVKFKAWPVIYW